MSLNRRFSISSLLLLTAGFACLFTAPILAGIFTIAGIFGLLWLVFSYD